MVDGRVGRWFLSAVTRERPTDGLVQPQAYNPFVSLQWMLDGKTVGGISTRAVAEIPSREQALRIYTLGSAWFAHDDQRRGSLTSGKLADLAVLSDDYLTMPVERIGSLSSLLTMVGGRVVFATGDYVALAD